MFFVNLLGKFSCNFSNILDGKGRVIDKEIFNLLRDLIFNLKMEK
jgi:hypothetical protein